MAAGPAAGGGVRLSMKLLPVVMALFFAFGFCTVLIDTLTPKLKELFTLSYQEVALTPFAFFGAYFIMALPGSWLLSKLGYLQSVTVGLVVMAAGCLLFTPAAQSGQYSFFLLAVFVLAGGVTIVQVAANPLAANIGDARYSHSRLTLAQAFNSLATMVGPLFGAALILKGSRPLPDPKTVSPAALDALRRTEAHAVQGPFFGIAIAVLVLAGLCALFYRYSPKQKLEDASGYAKLLRDKRLMFGVCCIFLYVGAEVAIGSFLTNYLLQPSVGLPALQRWADAHGGLAIQAAGSLVSVYWGLAMVGRFIGAGVLRKVKAGTVLLAAAVLAIVLASLSILSAGMFAGALILCVGFANSIMFPTIFTLAIEELGEDSAAGSGLLAMAIVGGAVIPLIVGHLADKVGLGHAFFVPVLCYVGIAFYGLATRNGWVDPPGARQPAEAGKAG
ncbi:MAG: sugar MFS transporter [Caulobacteraceae bacterium]|nr:sugar MFS transporter [Caulobacter sp.]